MTEPVSQRTAPELLQSARYILLDFDGPVCDVYAGSPAPAVADQLRTLLAELVPVLPDDVITTQDPLHVLRRAADLALDLAPRVEEALQAAELDAVASAILTPGVAEFLAGCRKAARPVAIVSNNSAPAIRAFLQRTGLDELVEAIAGRDPADPRRMKPDTHLLQAAVDALDAETPATLLIGDSLTDIQAARAFGIPIIALANKPAKVSAFADADVVITSMEGVGEQ